jgi:hypothetical protein
VVDSELGEPIPGAGVKVKPGGTPLTADSLGHFSIPDLKAGEVEVTVQAIGFESRSWKFNVQAGQAMDRSFSLDFTGEAARGGGDGAGQQAGAPLCRLRAPPGAGHRRIHALG